MVNGNSDSRVFQIDAGATVSISGVTITGGRAAFGMTGSPATTSHTGGSGGAGGDGGGIYNLGMLLLSGDTISGNFAGTGGIGGPGIIVPGQTVRGGPGGTGGRGGQGAAGDPDHPTGGEGGLGGGGGGIYGTRPVTVTHSTIHANNAGDGGSSSYPQLGPNGGD